MAPSSHRPAPPAYVSTTRFPIRPTLTRRPPAPNPSTQHPAPSTPPRRPPFTPTAGSLPGEIPLSPTRGGDHTPTPTPTPTLATHLAVVPLTPRAGFLPGGILLSATERGPCSGGSGEAGGSAEDDGAGAVAQDPVLGVPPHRAGEHPALD